MVVVPGLLVHLVTPRIEGSESEVTDYVWRLRFESEFLYHDKSFYFHWPVQETARIYWSQLKLPWQPSLLIHIPLKHPTGKWVYTLMSEFVSEAVCHCEKKKVDSMSFWLTTTSTRNATNHPQNVRYAGLNCYPTCWQELIYFGNVTSEAEQSFLTHPPTHRVNVCHK